MLANDERQAALHALNHAAYKLEPPLHELEHALHPWVVFAIMPLFALANAGVPLGGDIVEALTSPVALGIVLGLVVGKQLGITLFAWLAVRSGVSELPEGIGWRHVYGAGWLAGIGFTMSLFISDLAFSEDSLVEDGQAGHPVRVPDSRGGGLDDTQGSIPPALVGVDRRRRGPGGTTDPRRGDEASRSGSVAT